MARGGRGARRRGDDGCAPTSREREIARGAAGASSRRSASTADEWAALSQAQSRLAHAAALHRSRARGAKTSSPKATTRSSRRLSALVARARRQRAAHDPALARDRRAARARAHPARRGRARAARLPRRSSISTRPSSRGSRRGSPRSTTSRASTACGPRRCPSCWPIPRRELAALAQSRRREAPRAARRGGRGGRATRSPSELVAEAAIRRVASSRHA